MDWLSIGRRILTCLATANRSAPRICVWKILEAGLGGVVLWQRAKGKKLKIRLNFLFELSSVWLDLCFILNKSICYGFSFQTLFVFKLKFYFSAILCVLRVLLRLCGLLGYLRVLCDNLNLYIKILTQQTCE